MDERDDTPRPLPQADVPPRPAFQFRIHTLLFVTTFLALLLSAASTPWPGAHALATLFAVTCFPALLTMAAVYGRNHLRAFAIGGLFPAIVMLIPVFDSRGLYELFVEASRFESVRHEMRVTRLIWMLSDGTLIVLVGLLAVWVRHLIVSGRDGSEK